MCALNWRKKTTVDSQGPLSVTAVTGSRKTPGRFLVSYCSEIANVSSTSRATLLPDTETGTTYDEATRLTHLKSQCEWPSKLPRYNLATSGLCPSLRRKTVGSVVVGMHVD